MDTLLSSAPNIVLLKQVYTCIDNTTLEGSDNCERIRLLCQKSIEMQNPSKGVSHVAAICVYPTFVRLAKSLLADSGIRVASVAGAFPAGQSPIEVKLMEVKYAVSQGADEIDMVISRGAFLEGNFEQVANEISAIRSATQGLTLKVILETGELLTPDNISKASFIAMDAGADFIKTSTGKIPLSATPEAVQVMVDAASQFFLRTGKRVGIKVAGGVSSPEQALQYAQIFTRQFGTEFLTNQYFRIGASRLTDKLFAFLT